MELLLIKNMIWPAILNIGVIGFLEYIIDRKKSSKYLGIISTILGFVAMFFIIKNDGEYIFLQIYLFMFLLSISLVILALKKRIDAFTIIGILLMLVMLILLLRFNLIEN